MALIITVADDNGITVIWSGVTISTGMRRVNLQDLTHQPGTHTHAR